jgi:hypothetical protein
VLVSITSEFEPRKLLVSLTSYAYNIISTYVTGRLEVKTQYFLCGFILVQCSFIQCFVEWTDQSMYTRYQDLVFCNLLTYDRLVYGHILLMEHVWLINHESITCRIVCSP